MRSARCVKAIKDHVIVFSPTGYVTCSWILMPTLLLPEGHWLGSLVCPFAPRRPEIWWELMRNIWKEVGTPWRLFYIHRYAYYEGIDLTLSLSRSMKDYEGILREQNSLGSFAQLSAEPRHVVLCQICQVKPFWNWPMGAMPPCYTAQPMHWHLGCWNWPHWCPMHSVQVLATCAYCCYFAAMCGYGWELGMP